MDKLDTCYYIAFILQGNSLEIHLIVKYYPANDRNAQEPCIKSDHTPKHEMKVMMKTFARLVLA